MEEWHPSMEDNCNYGLLVRTGLVAKGLDWI